MRQDCEPLTLILNGQFTRLADDFFVTDLEGHLVETIVAGATVVHGPWHLVTKTQVAKVVGVVTESMYNAVDDKGKPVYEFQGNGWRPQASAGDFLLVDVNKPEDRWSCQPGLFGAWHGTADEDGAVTYVKPGNPLLALRVPVGTRVQTLEGPYVVAEGELLTLTKAEKGDFFVWPANTVSDYIRPYTDQ